jgi:diguanylate cyclase (GGDEF)-like protein
MTKFLLSFVLAGVVSISLASWQGYRSARASLMESSFDRLTAIRATKKRQIETYFEQIENQAIGWAKSPTVITALMEFRRAFIETGKEGPLEPGNLEELDRFHKEFNGRLQKEDHIQFNSQEFDECLPPEGAAAVLQYRYIVQNPFPRLERSRLDDTGDRGLYSRVHSTYHPFFRDIKERFGFFDIFLIDAGTGDILYTVDKEIDFATNLLSGSYRDTGLASVFRESVRSEKNMVRLVDYEFYMPLHFAPAAFIATPVFDGETKLGVLVFQISIDEIDMVMTGDRNWREEGLGKSGETYLVGSDHKMRSDSRFMLEDMDGYLKMLEKNGIDSDVIRETRAHGTAILFQKAATEAAVDALEGNTKTGVIRGYRGKPVLSSYSPLDIGGVHWALLSEIDLDEVLVPVRGMRDRAILITLVISGILAFFGFVFATSITRPVSRLKKAAQEFGMGNLDRRVPVISNDELGQLCLSFNSMAGDLQKSNYDLKKAREVLEQRVMERTAELDDANSTLQAEISERKRVEEKLRSLSITDELTALHNRRGFFMLFEQQLKLASRKKRSVYLLYSDIDDFKNINDTFGHKEGDQLLMDFADILRETYRDSDIVARIGGDEFVIFPIEAAEDSLQIITDRLFANIEAYNKKTDRGYSLSISVGVSLYDPALPYSIEEMLALADKQMYRHKRSKKETTNPHNA